MLVLSRHLDESVVIGTSEGDIIITVVGLRGDKVRLGISAPDSMPIHRTEVWDAIQRTEGRVRPGGSLRRYGADGREPPDGAGG